MGPWAVILSAFGCGYLVGITHVLVLIFFIVKLNRSKSVNVLVCKLLGEEPRLKKPKPVDKPPVDKTNTGLSDTERPRPKQLVSQVSSQPDVIEKVVAHDRSESSVSLQPPTALASASMDGSVSDIVPLVRVAQQLLNTEGVKEGWLQMRVMKKWRRHFFKLEVQRGWLSYFKNEQARSDQLIGLIKLFQCNISRKKKLSRKEKRMQKRDAKEGGGPFSPGEGEEEEGDNLVIKIDHQYKKSIFRRTGYDQDLPRSSGRHYLLHKFSKSSSCHLRATNAKSLKEWQVQIQAASLIDGNMPHHEPILHSHHALNPNQVHSDDNESENEEEGEHGSDEEYVSDD